jgi:hypothetical protein
LVSGRGLKKTVGAEEVRRKAGGFARTRLRDKHEIAMLAESCVDLSPGLVKRKRR